IRPGQNDGRPVRMRYRRDRRGRGRITTVPMRLSVHRRGVAAMACGLVGIIGGALVSTGTASAQAKLDARYLVTLSGLTIGRGTWVIDIGHDEYTVVANGKTTGLLSVISDGKGSTAARGRVVRGNLVPASYASNVTTDTYTEDMRVTLANGNVKDS